MHTDAGSHNPTGLVRLFRLYLSILEIKTLMLLSNTNYNAPMSLRSMTWEGDWNRPYYKSV